jgi:phosphogluconate dehydratase
VRDGDLLRVDAGGGRLDVLVADDELLARPPAEAPAGGRTLGRALFAPMRRLVGPADRGASVFAPVDIPADVAVDAGLAEELSA